MTGGNAETPSSTPTALAGDAEALGQLYDRVEAVGREDPGFSQVVMDVESGLMLVYWTDEAPDPVRRRYTALADPGVVRLRAALLTAGQIEDLRVRVLLLKPQAHAEGTRFSIWGPRDHGGPYEIVYGGSEPSDAIRRELTRYGRDTVVFRVGSAAVPLGL